MTLGQAEAHIALALGPDRAREAVAEAERCGALHALWHNDAAREGETVSVTLVRHAGQGWDLELSSFVTEHACGATCWL